MQLISAWTGSVKKKMSSNGENIPHAALFPFIHVLKCTEGHLGANSRKFISMPKHFVFSIRILEPAVCIK